MRDKISECKYFKMSDCNIDQLELKSVCKTPTDPIVEEFIKLFVLKYSNRWIYSCSSYYDPWETEHPEPEPNPTLSNEWLNKFSYMEQVTEDRYLQILKLYNNNKEHLLDKIKASSVTKYNDTPQTAQGATDPYTSSITTNEREVDPTELIDRLSNIERKYSDIMRDWIDEFNHLFGTSVLYND